MPLDFREKVKQLPEPVREILLSDLPAEETYKIATSYGISPKDIGKIAQVGGMVFVNDVPLEKFAEAIQKVLNVSEPIAAGLAAQITKAIFLPIKEYFPKAGTLIQTWSQKAALPTQPPQSLNLVQKGIGQTTAAPSQTTSESGDILERHVPAMMAEREEIANQLITGSPIKFAESEMLKLPSIKNWLYDYHKYKSQFPDQDIALVRTRYLHENPNTKTLSEQERIILGQVLKSYDERTRLPFSKTTGRLLIEKLISVQTEPAPVSQKITPSPSPPPLSRQVPAQAPPAPVPPPTPTPRPIFQPPAPPPPPPPPVSSAPPSPPQPSPAPPTGLPTKKDTYREEVAPEDMTGPGQTPQRPAPKLNGNIINLRENYQDRA